MGALLSAFLLGVVLVRLEIFFGIPPATFYFLAALPAIFALYDFYCYQKEAAKLGPFLKGIAIVNVAYCFLSLGAAFHHADTITALGWAYVLGEILVVTALAMVEYRVAKRWISNGG